MGLVVGGEKSAPGIVEGVVVPPGNDGNVKDSNGTETGTVKKPPGTEEDERGRLKREVKKEKGRGSGGGRENKG